MMKSGEYAPSMNTCVVLFSKYEENHLLTQLRMPAILRRVRAEDGEDFQIVVTSESAARDC